MGWMRRGMLCAPGLRPSVGAAPAGTRVTEAPPATSVDSIADARRCSAKRDFLRTGLATPPASLLLWCEFEARHSAAAPPADVL